MRAGASRSSPPPPLSATYWVEPGRLLVGATPRRADRWSTAQRIDALLRAGIRVVLSLETPAAPPLSLDGGAYQALLEERARRAGVEVTLISAPLQPDLPPTAETTHILLDLIEGALGAGQPLFLHCTHGHGRSGMVAGCWLVRQGAEPPAALDLLAALRRHDPLLAPYPCPAARSQRQWVRHWAAFDG